MKLFDSHTHLYFNDAYPIPAEVVQRAIDAGVTKMVMPGVNSSTIEPIKSLRNLFPENVHIGVGLHPTDVEPSTWRDELSIIESELERNHFDYVAIGESGIDLHWDASTLDLQQQVFEHQLQLAKKYSLPVIIHSRDAFEQTYEVLDGVKDLPETVFHSYSGDVAETEKILAKYPNARFGINGIVTFKNARIKEVLPVIPDDRLLIETDAPYLAPVPKRGQTNESAFIVYTADFIAKEKGMTADELGALTYDNAMRFFKIKE